MNFKSRYSLYDLIWLISIVLVGGLRDYIDSHAYPNSLFSGMSWVIWAPWIVITLVVGSITTFIIHKMHKPEKFGVWGFAAPAIAMDIFLLITIFN